jgi:hypothetical protein
VIELLLSHIERIAKSCEGDRYTAKKWPNPPKRTSFAEEDKLFWGVFNDFRMGMRWLSAHR